MVGNAISPPMVRLFGKDGTVLVGLGFMAACYFLQWFSPHFYWLSYPAFVCVGMGWSMCLVPLQARLMETAGERAQLALALNASAFFGGQGLGAAGGGAVYAALGPVALPIASVVVLALAAGVYLVSRKA